MYRIEYCPPEWLPEELASDGLDGKTYETPELAEAAIFRAVGEHRRWQGGCGDRCYGESSREDHGYYTVATVADVIVESNGYGIYQIMGMTEDGRAWIDARVHGADDGIAYSDETRLAYDIYEGAIDAGLNARMR